MAFFDGLPDIENLNWTSIHPNFWVPNGIYCHVPARWGLQNTHPGLQVATVRPQVDLIHVKHLT